mmetsp:Transcript_26958/g.70839  ORF Transcript_26958/g.70839 Transcript_26958/m.70839 type:complete len:216 (+) Transcript_26958:588-1235(+)
MATAAAPASAAATADGPASDATGARRATTRQGPPSARAATRRARTAQDPQRQTAWRAQRGLPRVPPPTMCSSVSTSTNAPSRTAARCARARRSSAATPPARSRVTRVTPSAAPPLTAPRRFAADPGRRTAPCAPRGMRRWWAAGATTWTSVPPTACARVGSTATTSRAHTSVFGAMRRAPTRDAAALETTTVSNATRGTASRRPRAVRVPTGAST